MGLLDNNVFSKSFSVTKSMSNTGEIYRFDNSAHKYNALRVFANYVQSDGRAEIEFVDDAGIKRFIYSTTGELGLKWGPHSKAGNLEEKTVIIDISGSDYVIMNNLNAFPESRTFTFVPLAEIPDSVSLLRPRQNICVVEHTFTDGVSSGEIDTGLQDILLKQFKYVQLFWTSVDGSQAAVINGSLVLRGRDGIGINSMSANFLKMACEMNSYYGGSDWVELSAISALSIAYNLTTPPSGTQKIQIKIVGIR